MADKHSLNFDVRELKLGASFTNNKASQYHTIKYDFKPASVDMNKMATVDVGTNNQVTVTVPHLDGAGVPHTVFKGNQRPYTKECVLIIDRVTGEITLEKLSSNIQVKKTRQESASKPRPLTPVAPDHLTNTTARSSSRTRVATNRRTQQPQPAGAGTTGAGMTGAGAAPRPGAGCKPPHIKSSPPRMRTSPPQAAPWQGGGNSTLASLPMIGLDDAPAPAPAYAPRPERLPERIPERERIPEKLERVTERANERTHVPERLERAPERLERAPERLERVPERLERAPERVDRGYVPERREPINSEPQRTAEDSSSSSSSDSDSGSGSDSDSDDDRAPAQQVNGDASNTTLPSDVLNDDLCLSSESGSDSD